MKRATPRYLLAVGLVGGSLFAAAITIRRVETGADVQLAAALLAEGQATQAQTLLAAYDGHRSEWLFASAIRRGLQWSELLRGQELTQEAAAGLLAARDPFPKALLLLRLLQEGHFRAVAGLVEAGPPAVRSQYGLLAQVARLEMGEPIALDVADPQLRSELERKLSEVAELRRMGHRQIVRDRNGRLLGSTDAGGDFVPSPQAADLGIDGWVEEILAPHADAPGVRLSIDLELTELARKAIGSVRGTIVVLDLHGGGVLAAVSERRTLAREGTAPFRDQLLEPASIAKLITTSAALRAGVDVDDEIRSAPCRGSIEVEDGHLYCPVVAGRLSGLDEALAVSCNTTFARMGTNLGADLLVDEHRRFGFALPQSSERSLARLRSPIATRRQLAELSVGLNHSELSPLHAARIAAVFGNGGQLLEPRWVVATDGYLGRSPRTTAAASGETIVDPVSQKIVQRAMAAVATYGTLGGIAPRDYPVAMKTGTASEPGRGFHVNYIGLGPWPDPHYAFAIRVTDQRTSRRVRRAARSVTARFLRALASYDRRTDPVPVASHRGFGVATGGP